jgi:hypothetical protein
MDYVDSCQFGVNDAGTGSKIDTPLTQSRSPSVRRQLLHLSSVYRSSPGYYREALRPVIRKIISRLDGERT